MGFRQIGYPPTAKQLLFIIVVSFVILLFFIQPSKFSELLQKNPRTESTDSCSPQAYDRAWAQNLYLKPSSPLLSTLSLPEGFDIASTPLITFRRIDLLPKDELIFIHNSSQSENITLHDTSLFSDEGIWTLPVTEYLSEFLAPLPKANYVIMVVSTAGHWTTGVFSKVEPPGMEGILSLFEVAMERRAVVRAYLPGHYCCHDFRHPWNEIHPAEWYSWNWADISKLNTIFEAVVMVVVVVVVAVVVVAVLLWLWLMKVVGEGHQPQEYGQSTHPES
jgi:hypothetical protein